MAEYVTGSGIEVPGLEAVLEYGDASSAKFDRIQCATRINDRDTLEQVRLTQIDGLQDDPEGRDIRAHNSDRHGETFGRMLYGGRTIGLTGKVQAGSIPAMRDKWAQMQRMFGVTERDLLIHLPNEVGARFNEVCNPSMKIDANGWEIASGGTLEAAVVDGAAKVGRMSGTAISAIAIYYNNQSFTPNYISWCGEDVFISVLVKVHAASAVVSAISADLIQWKADDTGFDGSMLVAAQEFPVTGTWYRIQSRFAASAFNRLTDRVALRLRLDGASGDYTLHFAEAAMVFLSSDDPTPLGSFSGDTDGFEWAGVPHASRSSGPHYAVNKIPDPLFSEATTTGNNLLQRWVATGSSGIVVTTPATRTYTISGSEVPGSLYAKLTKDSNATARDMYVAPDDLFDDVFLPIVGGRTYRLSFRADVAQKPSTGTLAGRVRWLDLSRTTVISTSSTSAMSIGAQDISGEFPAPAGAAWAEIRIGVEGTTTADGVLEINVSDPCFIDISDFDPGDFYGVGGDNVESRAYSYVVPPIRARRRIPRPFLIESIRKTSDAKAPEQQQNDRAWRDFTMSMRASDPRIYVFGDRYAQTKMGTASQFVTRQMPIDFTLDDNTLTVPTGWTYEGNFVTHPGFGTPYEWSQQAYNWITAGLSQASHKNGGVGIKAWSLSGLNGLNRPAQYLRTRMYRSAEAYTYESPRVVLGCSPLSYGTTQRYIPSLGPTHHPNQAEILLKRVSSGTWLELRWTSMSNAYGALAGDEAPYSFELWCSHDTSGVAATTRLSQWDYESIGAGAGNLPFDAYNDEMYLVAYMLSEGGEDVVYWELWNGPPSDIDPTNNIESGSYTLTAGLESVIGTGVAGHVGFALTVPNCDDQDGFNFMSGNPPYLHYFEARMADVSLDSIKCPVIGSIETPQKITIGGGLVDPVLMISVSNYDNDPGRTSIAKFNGEIISPVTIDLADGSVLDAEGANRYDLLLPGATFEIFRPGMNAVYLQAVEWSVTDPIHLSARWRDALR